MTGSIERRIADLEKRQFAALRRSVPTVPVYTIIQEGEPRPAVAGPVYRLVSMKQENGHA